ncbi:MAG TPA: Arc family DNA binding domain-containing protein [Panacibacter sp.]|nr:Arc family DNA binding domain-containing protein [Panacibacter sp.]
MAVKKSFVLRIDEATYKALEKWAGDDFRSVNGQIEFILDQKLKEAGRLKNTTAADTEKNSVKKGTK